MQPKRLRIMTIPAYRVNHHKTQTFLLFKWENRKQFELKRNDGIKLLISELKKQGWYSQNFFLNFLRPDANV
jgi:hypothetical protein